MTASTYRLYGLWVRSEIPLHGPASAPGSRGHDVDLRWGEPARATDQPAGDHPLLDLVTDRRVYSAARLADDRVVFRVHGTCEFRVHPDLSTVDVGLVPGADPALLEVFATGALLALLLTLRGDPPLHASAVQVGADALAFVGASGMGKSTMATLMCVDGARSITDDVLRLDLPAGGLPRCHLGAVESRLRAGAGALDRLFDEPVRQRTTSDDRNALQLPAATTEGLPLSGIVIPLPDHVGGTVEATRLEASQALLALLRFPRLLGWCDDAVLASVFHAAGEVAERVPMYAVNLPWGPPFPPDLPARLLEELGWSPSGAASPGQASPSR